MNEQQKRIIRALQAGLPISLEPYKEVAAGIGITEEELLEQIGQWKADGTIRRLGAILRHHDAGYSTNAMGVWNVPDDQVESFGAEASALPQVSHCYQRPRFADFRYNLYTMIHGKTRAECEEVARRISEQNGITEYKLLYTTAEFKKSSPVYFAEKPE